MFPQMSCTPDFLVMIFWKKGAAYLQVFTILVVRGPSGEEAPVQSEPKKKE